MQIAYISCCEAYGDEKNTKDVQCVQYNHERTGATVVCCGCRSLLATSIVHNLHMCKLKSSVSSLYSGTGRSSCRAGKNRLMLLW